MQDILITNTTDGNIRDLHIEDYVAIAPRVTFVLHASPEPSPLSKLYESKVLPIYIKKGAWVGCNAVILGGITVGEFSIVGAGAVVTKDVPPYTVVAGVPAKVIKYIPKNFR